MKKSIGYLLVAILLFAATSSLTACGAKNAADYTRVTMEMNPSVEFIVDKQDKVLSVTALNDDGATLIVGEAFVGKDISTAATQVVTLAVETGFLVKGRVETGTNTLAISVSGSKSQSKKTYQAVLNSAYNYLKKAGVDTYIERISAWGETALRNAVAENSLFTQEEINAMNEQQLYSALAASRIETAQLLTEELRTAYFAAKKHEIALAQHETVLNLIELTDELFGVAHIAYIQAVNGLSSAIKSLDALRYEKFVASTSDYQIALANLRTKKDEWIAAKLHAASFTEDNDSKGAADVAVIQAGYAYDAALNLLTSLKENADYLLSSLIQTLTAAEQALIVVEESFPDSIRQTLIDGAAQIDKAVNEKKAAYFAAFEQAHAADIAKILSAMQTRKAALIAAAKGE